MIKKNNVVLTMFVILCFVGITQADTFWGSASPNWGNSGGVLFKLDTTTGNIGTIYSPNKWSWIMGVTYAPGNTLYAIHNTTSNLYEFQLAKVNALTGQVISDIAIKDLTNTDYPIWNSVEYHNGKLYAVENNSWGSGYSANANRGRVYEVSLDASGNPTSAVLGAYIGGFPAPDGALAYNDGTWYASDWKTDTSSWLKTTSDIMNTNFTASVSTTPVGLFSGWDFEEDNDLIGVSWYYDFNVYKIDIATGSANALYNIDSQLPGEITMLGGLSDTNVPEPTVLLLLNLGLVSLVGIRRGIRRC